MALNITILLAGVQKSGLWLMKYMELMIHVPKKFEILGFQHVPVVHLERYK